MNLNLNLCSIMQVKFVSKKNNSTRITEKFGQNLI